MGYPLSNILFLDIETVPQYASYDEVPEEWKKLWDHKAQQLVRGKEDETVETVYPNAGIYAEFGQIICISCGVIQGVAPARKIVIKSFSGNDEVRLLRDFNDMLVKWSLPEQKYLCAHNGKNFDFPYLCRRMMINQIPIPPILDTAGKKPWEISHIDTMDLWKFGEYKNFTSLNLLAHALGVPTPKDDIDGKHAY
ncbi:MAG: 3'-5' exonuclease [Chitinophagaceae bacterium]|nr:MAG: 3'-5' exonuclease [Chitinophagaceae bacterium]